jgi:hypothetical protein
VQLESTFRTFSNWLWQGIQQRSALPAARYRVGSRKLYRSRAKVISFRRSRIGATRLGFLAFAAIAILIAVLAIFLF